MASEEYESYYSYYEAEEDPEGDEADESSESPPAVPEVVGGRFRLKHEIGSGSYSTVYLGTDNESGDQVAVKVEWQKAEKTGKLLDEARLYEALVSSSDVPRMHWYGIEGQYNVMVLELLGPSVEQMFRKCGKFSVKTTLLLAEQMIDRLEYVHEQGVLYRDIKPHNFLMGRGDRSNRVYLVDFGLSKSYLNPTTGEHIPCSRKKGVTGTVRYSSLNVHEGCEAGRRDDLEALGYVLLHFLRGTLPWQGLKASSKKTKHEIIKKCKKKTSDEELCKGFPNEFVEYFRYCRSLQFAEKPDYERLRQLMRDVCVRERYARDSVFDWMVWEERKSRRQNGAGSGEAAGAAEEPRARSRSRRRERPSSRSEQRRTKI